MGRRRKPSRLPWGRIAVLAAAVVVVGVVFALPDPAAPGPRHVDTSAVAAPTPTWHGPPTVDAAGTLADGTAYTPRVYLTVSTSVGVAATPDGRSSRLVARTTAKTTELRRLATSGNPQYDAFAVSGDTLVWAETAGGATSLWYTKWTAFSRPVMITTVDGDVAFAGSQYDLALNGGRVYWTQVVGGSTQVWSTDLSGYDQRYSELTGQFGLSAWPWVVSRVGRGRTVQLVNLTTNRKLTVPVGANQSATCAPTWCRIDTVADSGLARIDVRRTDATGSAQAAGNEATPATGDGVLLDRWVALITDEPNGTGLSLYDVDTGQTTLVAVDVDGVKSWGAILWWSTGTGTDLRWHALDLRSLT